MMTASSACRKLDPGEEKFEEISRLGVSGDDGWVVCRILGRIDDTELDAIASLASAHHVKWHADMYGLVVQCEHRFNIAVGMR
jgi:hypothetical protein